MGVWWARGLRKPPPPPFCCSSPLWKFYRSSASQQLNALIRWPGLSSLVALWELKSVPWSWRICSVDSISSSLLLEGMRRDRSLPPTSVHSAGVNSRFTFNCAHSIVALFPRSTYLGTLKFLWKIVFFKVLKIVTGNCSLNEKWVNFECYLSVWWMGVEEFLKANFMIDCSISILWGARSRSRG